MFAVSGVHASHVHPVGPLWLLLTPKNLLFSALLQMHVFLLELCLPFEKHLWPVPCLVLVFIGPPDIALKAEESCRVLWEATGRCDARE